MWSTRNVGSLAVIEQTQDRKRIEAELKRFDNNLFLDGEIDTRGRFVWAVKEHIGSEHPPHLVFEWRDEEGVPLPLTSGLLEEVRKIGWRRDHGITVFDVVSEANDQRRADQMRAAAEAYEAIGNDFMPRMNGIRSACLHRGVHLRMARDKRRARGFKV